jgi:hypothetical protein
VGAAQHLVCAVAQTFQEVSGLGLFPTRGSGVQGQTHGDGLGEEGQVEPGDLGWDVLLAGGARPVRGGVERQQRIPGLARPDLAGVRLVGGGQFPVDVRAAQRVGGLRVGAGVVDRQGVMHGGAGEGR